MYRISTVAETHVLTLLIPMLTKLDTVLRQFHPSSIFTIQTVFTHFGLYAMSLQTPSVSLEQFRQVSSFYEGLFFLLTMNIFGRKSDIPTSKH